MGDVCYNAIHLNVAWSVKSKKNNQNILDGITELEGKHFLSEELFKNHGRNIKDSAEKLIDEAVTNIMDRVI